MPLLAALASLPLPRHQPLLVSQQQAQVRRSHPLVPPWSWEILRVVQGKPTLPLLARASSGQVECRMRGYPLRRLRCRWHRRHPLGCPPLFVLTQFLLCKCLERRLKLCVHQEFLQG